MRKNKQTIKKILFLITTYFTIILTVNANSGKDKNELYPYNTTPQETISPYTTYSKGNIYIADEDTIRRIIVDSSDVYIIDERDNQRDPDMCVCNSYKIRSKEQIEEIIDILLEYEKENPSPWDRSKESLINEWLIHKFGYEMGYKISRTMNVDLDNNDEEKFNGSPLNLILK